MLQENWQTIARRSPQLRWPRTHQGRRWLHRHGLQLVFPHRLEALLPQVVWHRHALGSSRCPKTVALLNQIPGIKAAMFASVAARCHPGSPPRPYAGSLRYHLGLITLNSLACFIEVDGQRYHWKDGEVVMFDEPTSTTPKTPPSNLASSCFADVARRSTPPWCGGSTRLRPTGDDRFGHPERGRRAHWRTYQAVWLFLPCA